MKKHFLLRAVLSTKKVMKTSRESARILRELRERQKLSQQDVAHAIGVDRTTYVKYENGGSIRRSLNELADFFNLCVFYILGRDTPPPPQIKAWSGFAPLSAAEKELVQKFRSLDADQKGAVETELEYFLRLNRRKK